MGAPDDQDEFPEPDPDEQAPPPDPDDYDTWHRCPVCRHRVMPNPFAPDRTVHPRCEPHLATTNHERHTA